jgi:hypothetical protein
MSKTIVDYTPAIAVDAANDYLLIEPSGNTVYKSINRNTLLGLSSQPLGLTDTQSPTNKTLDNTNSLTVKDSNLTLQYASGVTQQAKFSASAITAGQTRTFTFPDASGTLVTTALAQTLTNKTLTAPVVSGGTIDNSTITVDSIAGHTVATTVTVANLQIANGVLNSANAVTATSIAAGAIQPQTLVAGTGSGWAWASWTPTWTNLTVGNATQVALYQQTGKTINFRLYITFGTTSSVSGGMTFTLPVTSNSSYIIISQVGFGNSALSSGTGFYPMSVVWASTTTANMLCMNASGTYSALNVTSSTVPFTWTTGSVLSVQGSYEAA